MSEATFRRYTSLPALIHLLSNKVITLVSPSSWDDRNDAFFLTKYRERRSAKSVLVLCFARAPEMYHHWRVFTRGADGVCIQFDEHKLLNAINATVGLRSGPVIYKTIPEFGDPRPSIEELPFLKRYPYSDEREYRLLYVDDQQEIESKEFPIPLDCIERIAISPWIPEAFIPDVKKTLRSIDGCRDLRVYRTTLLENERWKSSAVAGK